MWHATLSRRDFIELCLGAPRSLEKPLKRASTIAVRGDDGNVDCYWDQEIEATNTLPNIALVPDKYLSDLLTSVNASPQAPTPITAMCRLLTHAEATQHFDARSLDLTINVLPATVALSMAEAAIHADGRIGLRQISTAMCKRTLSYAWGRALANRSPLESIQQLPVRWLETYQLINADLASDTSVRAIGAVVGALAVATQLSAGIRPESPAGAMAYALLTKEPGAIDMAWRELARLLEAPPSLDLFSKATREERGMYLQQALRESLSIKDPDARHAQTAYAACAIIATQVAPGSLEHFELLRTSAGPETLVWYALFATLQATHDIMTTQQGLGRRLLRDVAQTQDQLGRPTADMAFSELKTLERVGISSIARKLGHVGEVEVELIPFVTSSFTYSSRPGRSREHGPQLQLDADHDPTPKGEVSAKTRMNQLLSQLLALVHEMPDRQLEPPHTTHKTRRK